MKIEFRAVKKGDLEQLRQWRNSESVSQFMYTQQQITQEQQSRWYQKLCTDNTQRYFVCYVQNLPVGCLYFSDVTDSSCYWGCYIGNADKTWVGTGIVMEAAALDYALDYLKLAQLNAEVITSNKPPQRLHKMFKYQFGEEFAVEGGCKRIAVQGFMYTRDNWLHNRTKILTKLPVAIRNVVCNASFLDETDRLVYKLKQLEG